MTPPISTMKFDPRNLRAKRRTRRPIIAFVAFALASLAIGCVTRELHSVDDSRRAYDDCILEYSASHRDCEALRDDHVEAQRQYDERARRAWGCNSNDDPCPTPR